MGNMLPPALLPCCRAMHSWALFHACALALWCMSVGCRLVMMFDWWLSISFYYGHIYYFLTGDFDNEADHMLHILLGAGFSNIILLYVFTDSRIATDLSRFTIRSRKLDYLSNARFMILINFYFQSLFIVRVVEDKHTVLYQKRCIFLIKGHRFYHIVWARGARERPI